MHDMEDTHVLSMCMALHCNLPPLRQWGKRQGVEVASKLAANARFDVRPRHRVSQRIDPCTSLEAAMLQCLEGEAAVADDGDILPSFGGSEVPPACQGATRADRQAPSGDTEGTVVEPDGSPAQHGGNHDFFTFRRGMQCAVCRQSVCASGATHVWFATHALSRIQDRVMRQWCRLQMMQPRLLKITVKRKHWHHGSPTQSVPWPVHRPSWYVLQRPAHCVTGHAPASVIAWVPWV